MQYAVKFGGYDSNSAAHSATEFACTEEFLNNVQTNDVITNFDGFVEDVGEEISAQVWFGWESNCDYIESEGLEDDYFDDEEGYWVYEDWGFETRMYHGWGMSDTIALTVGAVIANAMRDQLRRYWIARIRKEGLVVDAVKTEVRKFVSNLRTAVQERLAA